MRKPKIVFLDAGTVDFGDVSFAAFKRLGAFRAYSNTGPGQIAGRIRGASVVIANKCRFDRAVFQKAGALKCLCVAATGTDMIDLKAARECGIAVTNVAGYSTESVAELTFAFILELAWGLQTLNRAAHGGLWSRSPFFTLAGVPIRELRAKTLGIVGYGSIGRRVGAIARSFGMKVAVAKIPGRRYGTRGRVRRQTLESVLKRADFVTLHAPLTPLTENLIDARRLRLMRPDAYLINMARGGMVNEKALRQALVSGRLAGAAADVLSVEPPPRRHVLLGAPRLILTPHVAWASPPSRQRLIDEMAANIRAFQQGKKRNRVV